MASDTRHSRGGGRRERPDPIDKIAATLSDKVTRQAARLDQAVERQQRAAEKLHAKADQLERASERLAALELWMRKPAPARKPRFTRDEIAQTAIEIADAEGFGAVSMRRIASELESGTMTLYHYVRTKDELLSLVLDAVMGELVVPEAEFPDTWRTAVTAIAERTRAALVRHPWIFDITDDPPLGPNSVRHFDQSLQAVASLDIPFADKLDLVGAVDAFVFGFCLHERNNAQSDTDPFDADVKEYVNGLIRTGEYPELAALADEVGIDAVWSSIRAYSRDEMRFARGLERLLDGFEASLPDH
jgi:AcrR family transcriptional regulator